MDAAATAVMLIISAAGRLSVLPYATEAACLRDAWAHRQQLSTTVVCRRMVGDGLVRDPVRRVVLQRR